MEEILSKPRSEQVAYWVGHLCLAIGKGDFKEQVNLMIDFYQRDAYERGVKMGESQSKGITK